MKNKEEKIMNTTTRYSINRQVVKYYADYLLGYLKTADEMGSGYDDNLDCVVCDRGRVSLFAIYEGDGTITFYVDASNYYGIDVTYLQESYSVTPDVDADVLSDDVMEWIKTTIWDDGELYSEGVKALSNTGDEYEVVKIEEIKSEINKANRLTLKECGTGREVVAVMDGYPEFNLLWDDCEEYIIRFINE